MRTTRRTTATLVAFGLGGALVLGAGAAIAQSGDAPGTATTTSTSEVVDVLLVHLEEERLAGDLYDALGEAHDGLAPFERIEVSEQRHYDAIAQLLTLRDATLPTDEEPGVYADEDLQEKYDDWLERGLVSPAAAYAVGVELETADITALRSDIEAFDDDDVDRVLGHLLDASQHHLAAFEAAAVGERPGRMGGGMGMGGRGHHGGQHHGGGPAGCPLSSTDDA